jgi:uncharacterized protein YjbI with pentapeptide repeats
MFWMTLARLSERYNAGERNFAGIRLYSESCRKPEVGNILKLRDLILSDIILSGADLSDSNLSLINLHGAQLVGSQLSDTY